MFSGYVQQVDGAALKERKCPPFFGIKRCSGHLLQGANLSESSAAVMFASSASIIRESSPTCVDLPSTFLTFDSSFFMILPVSALDSSDIELSPYAVVASDTVTVFIVVGVFHVHKVDVLYVG